MHGVEELARQLGIGHGQVERGALTQHVWPERYVRNSRTLSLEDQLTMLDTTVAVVGLGGLGGIAVDTLARLGVGTLTLIDGDAFEESNLNRQMLATVALMGTTKVEAAARRVEAVNPAVTACPHEQFLTAENAHALLSGASLVMDCLDTISARLTLEKAARSLGIPLVSGAVAGLSGQVTVVYPKDPGLAALYGSADAAPERGIETALGNLAPAVNIIASLQCTEVVKVILDRPGQLRNRLLLMDLADNSFDVMELG
ncbi:MAG: HesA/MoeB/ThiF family protein [Desulfobacterales bacterium]|nr:HesA/MoeB/ThiF family protein [Desulfobacterales bacterium]